MYLMNKNKTIVGKQYGYRSSAIRAITRFITRHFSNLPSGTIFWVNQIDDGCFEIVSGII